VTYKLRLSEIGRIAEFVKIWTDLTFRHEFASWRNFAMTTPGTLHTKIATNELRFPPVTLTAYFDTWFGRYRLLKSGYSVELF
jgi:hypothetical protein